MRVEEEVRVGVEDAGVHVADFAGDVEGRGEGDVDRGVGAGDGEAGRGDGVVVVWAREGRAGCEWSGAGGGGAALEDFLYCVAKEGYHGGCWRQHDAASLMRVGFAMEVVAGRKRMSNMWEAAL